MPRTVTIEDPEEFCARHGGVGRERVARENFFLFPTGATATRDFNTRVEPPKDPTKLRAKLIEYFALRLKVEETDFNRYRAALSQAADDAKISFGVRPPSQAQIDELKRGREKVLELRAKLAELIVEDRQDPKSKRYEQEHRSKALREHAARMGDIQSAVLAIEI